MKNTIKAVILCCCCCIATTALADNDNECQSQGKPAAHFCTDNDLERGKVDVCHVPEGCPENAHNICVYVSAVDRSKNEVNHFTGAHGGDYLGTCVDPTPNPTATPTLPPEETPSPTATPTVTPTPTSTPSTSPTPERKVEICHILVNDEIGKEGVKAISIEVSENAVQAHLNHGDRVGACVFDCAGAPFGQASFDLCNVCGGDNSTCKDCRGVPNGESKIDACGVCGGDGKSCLGCDGVANSGKVVDACGVCGGDNSTCKDCEGTINGKKVVDQCGVCGGQNNTCLDCRGIPNGGVFVDSCGVCGGDGKTCLDCNGVPNGPAKPDLCGVCGGNNSCLDCAGVPNGGTLVDQCGVCGGPGGSTVKIKIDKKKLIKLADTLFFTKTVPYFNGAARCDKRFAGSSKKGTTLAHKTHAEIIQAIKLLRTEAQLCPGSCERDINKDLIREINRLAKIQYKYAAQAQHAGRKACKNDGPGLAKTKPVENNIHSTINNCPTHVCK